MPIDAFLELLKDDGPVEGESQDAIFTKFIEIYSFSMNAKRDMKSSKEEDLLSIGDLEPEDDEEINSDRSTMTNNKPGESISDSFTIDITKEVDLASPELFSNYCYSVADQSMPFDKAIFYFRVSGIGKSTGKYPDEVAFLMIELTQPVVYSYKLDTRSTSIPEESVGFYFQTFKVKYKPQKETGKLEEPVELGHSLGFAGDGS